jgi:hypothetical protein
MPPPDDYHDSSSEEGGRVPDVVGGTGTAIHPPLDNMNGSAGPNLNTSNSVNHDSISYTHNNNGSQVHHMSDDDESGNILERDYTGMFEGPEKTLEVVFRRIDDAHIDITKGEVPPVVGITQLDTNPQQPHESGCAASDSLASPSDVVNALSDNSAIPLNERKGLRLLDRADIDMICARARCTILSRVSNRYLDAYVLSESSLFIYPYMLVLKACGTTTLLRCIAVLIDLGRKLGLEIDWVGYSRKNFNFPGDQSFPHQSFHQELDYLYGHRKLCERLQGNGYTLGPVTGGHWFVFVADKTKRTAALEIDTDRVLNIMMFDIDENVAQLFYYDQYHQNVEGETKEDEVLRVSKEQTVESGIRRSVWAVGHIIHYIGGSKRTRRTRSTH